MTLRELDKTIDLMIEKHVLQLKSEGTEITLSATAFIKNFPAEKAKVLTPEQQKQAEDEAYFAHVGESRGGQGVV